MSPIREKTKTSFLFNTDEMTDRELVIHNYALEKGKEHTEPSKRTLDALEEIKNRLEERYIKKEDCLTNGKLCKAANLDPLMKEVSEIKTKVERLEAGQSQLLLSMSKMPELLIEKIDDRYADKKTVADIKDNIKWITRLVIGAVILALLGLVLTK